MKKENLLALSASSLIALMLTPPVQAEGWDFLPVTSDNYQADVAVALVGGRTDVDNDADVEGDDVQTLGAEVSLNCPLLKAPNHTIRQQVSYVETDEDGITTRSFEVNPHHMFKMGNKMQAGFGPSLGATKIETNAGDDTVFTYGLGANVRYNINDAVFLGGEARYAWSEDIDIAGVDQDFDNFRMLIKVGYQF